MLCCELDYHGKGKAMTEAYVRVTILKVELQKLEKAMKV